MQAETTTFGPFALDRRKQVLTRDGNVLPIGHRGFVLLETLLDADGQAVDKTTLMERVWPGMIIEESNLSVQIATLRKHLGGDAETLLITVPRVGYRLVASTAAVGHSTGPPLIAVLPFANHGSDAEQGYFADGVVDDIITALSRFKNFGVLSRGSTFALRNSAGDPRATAAAMGVHYALQGSVRRMGDRLRVTGQLIDAANGAHLWAEKFEGTVADVFSFQDRITEGVVGVIEPTIRKAEIERARRKPAANLDAYELFLTALPLVYGMEPERLVEAIALLRGSAALDPGFALPPAYAAWVYEKRISLRLPPLGNSDRETCLELARTALDLGGDDPLVRAICGWVLYRVAKDTSALKGLRQTVEENPNNVVILTLAGAGHMLNGAVDEAYQCYSRAYELSPGAPDAYQSLQGMGAAEVMRGNYEAGIEWCLKSLATFNDWLFTYITLATAYAKLDRMDEAKVMIRRVRELSPNLTIKVIEEGADPDEDQFATAMLPGLRKAGLPER